eukprot:jgi/Psemu1/189189/e_gw1.85.111.1
MGARHSSTSAAYYHNRSLAEGPTTSGDDDGGLQFAREILESCDPQLAEQYAVDGYLFPGSGRMMRTFRLRHKTNGSRVVVKLMWVLYVQKRELARVFRALRNHPHTAPFLYWKAGPEVLRPNTIAVRPAVLLRPYFYTTLSDRLASRPFLTHVEKLWIVYQLLQALDDLHNSNDSTASSTAAAAAAATAPIVHGFLTTENVGLSSWNWVVLLDLSASYKGRTALPDDDPSEYLYYFQERQTGSAQSNAQKRCYLAPERFYTPGATDGDKNEEGSDSPGEASGSIGPTAQKLTPAMDIFSAGCVIMETFLNGERAFDLGDLMEYRQRKTYTPTLQQKLNKIEFSALRAACKNMISLDPSQRLSAKEYLNRLEASGLLPSSSSDTTTNPNESEVAVVTPDSRLAKAAACYSEILHETMGVYDREGKEYFDRKVTGTDNAKTNETSRETNPSSVAMAEEKKESEQDALFAETEALLKKLEALTIDEDEVFSMASNEATTITERSDMDREDHASADPNHPKQSKINRSQLSESSLLIYLQLVLSTIRHVQRPASKLVALQLMKRLGRYSTDEARLQRIVPVAVSLLQDQDPLVRASSIEVLTSTISIVESFPPSDSKVFPQYLFKRVAHLVTDPSLVVRLAFARSVAVLAETAHRFLDISHAVRLYEAVGGGNANVSGAGQQQSAASKNVFGDDVAKLLGESAPPSTNTNKKENPKSLRKADSSDTAISDIMGTHRTLISNTYNSDLAALHETVSRWVIHITTDVSDHSSPVKRALLADMARLCNFFGLDGVMAFILPQILSFLNDRKDWQLRASLFEHLPAVCQFIGRAATEHFVLPILETALVDSEEVVIGRALLCLSELLVMGLLSRGVFLGRMAARGIHESPGLLQKYGTLLLHPSSDIRFNVMLIINALSIMIGHLDTEVFVVPIMRPYLRFQPSMKYFLTPHDLEKCLYAAWTRERFENELNRLIAAMESSPMAGRWTTIALQINDGDSENPSPDNKMATSPDKVKEKLSSREQTTAEDHTTRFCAYLQMLARSRHYAAKMGSDNDNTSQDMKHAIEGSLKLAQQLKFPRQDILGSPSATLPQWYATLLECRHGQTNSVRETAAIRTVSALGQVYGLSIMDQEAAANVPYESMTFEGAFKLLNSNRSKSIDAACRGEWGSETCLDPALTDTSLLLTKLNALEVPPLPPRLSEETFAAPRLSQPSRQYARESGDPRDSQVGKPKIDSVIATSRTVAGFGHTAPVVRLAVAHDQRFFVSGSQDGTCRVWESDKAEASNGVLESSSTYTMHTYKFDRNPPRINDLVMVEGSHSVASAGSDGSVHVWRVDLVSSSTTNHMDNNRNARRVAGSTDIKTLHPSEGEVLTVNQFNNQGSSLLTFATQKGCIHSWDLRSAKEPFCLKNFQDIGYITNMAIGSDRNWVVVGTNRGFISLWDLRFQQIMKLWHHSRSSPINRLATWVGMRSTDMDSKPYIFVASGPNECAMFDATTGHCGEWFRTVEHRSPSPRIDNPPSLNDVPLSTSARRKSLLAQGIGSARLSDVVSSSFQSINCMVGNMGNSDSSFLITGGSDRRIRFWDFSMATKCSVKSGLDPLQPRPSFQRIDYNNNSRLMLCHQAPAPALNEVDSSRVPRKLFQGTRAMPQGHDDSICDLKVLKHRLLLSCSRDCTVKLWR